MLKLYTSNKIAEYNRMYKIEEMMPGALLLGTDGGNEALVMDLREDSKTRGKFFRTPFIPLGWNDAILVGATMEQVKKAFKNLG